MRLAVQTQQQIDDKGAQDLGFYCVLVAAEEALDLQVLLHPFEEQLDVPAIFVVLRDDGGGGGQVVGGQHQRRKLVRACNGDAAQGCFIAIAALATGGLVREAHDLVGQNRVLVVGVD